MNERKLSPTFATIQDGTRLAWELDSEDGDLLSLVRTPQTFLCPCASRAHGHRLGPKVVELLDLRFVHRTMTARPKTATWRGVDAVVFMVDFAALVAKRMRKAPVHSWKPGKSDELRRAEWVYDPLRPSVKRCENAPQDVLPASEPLPSTYEMALSVGIAPWSSESDQHRSKQGYSHNKAVAE